MKRNIEKEFGVPIAGEILDPSLWSQTALKSLPAAGPIDFAAIFGRRAPMVVDLGCGNGRFLLGSALWRPTFDHLGIDVLPLVLRYATRRGNQRGLVNLRFAACDGQKLLAKYLGNGSCHEIHCYHPQPFHDPRMSARRLLTPSILAHIHRALEPKGRFFLQTDNLGYWSYVRPIVPHLFDFHDQPTPWPDAPKGRTRREIIALRRGMGVYRGWGIKRDDVSHEKALEIARELPLPTFDAGREIRELEEMERE